MALKDPYMVKTVRGNTDLSLTADSGESFRIIDIQVASPTSNYASILVAKTTAAYFRVGGNGGNHLQFMPQDEENRSLFGKLVDEGLHRPIPVAEGETFQITGVAQSGAIQKVVYQRYDAGDVSSDEPNGSTATEYDYIAYGSISTAPGDGTTEYDTSDHTTEFPAFPFEGSVPAKSEIDLKAILASDNSKTDGSTTNQQITTYLKLQKGRMVLFDEDRNGIPIEGVADTSDAVRHPGEGQSEIGQYSSEDQRPYLKLPTPLTFTGNEDLDVFLTTSVTAGSAQFAAGDNPVGFVLTIRAT